MEYRTLGGSDLEVSVIGFGAWGIGGAPFWKTEGDDESIRAIRKAFDLGITLFDTAPVYGFGHSEELMGKALKPVRDKAIIATKCGLSWSKEELGAISNDCTKKAILKEIDQSLKRLQTDWIDLYQVHWPDPKTPQKETMEALLEIQEQKKIRYIGVSNYSVEQMQDCLQYGKIVSIQPEYSLLQRSIEKETVPFCRENDIGIIAYSPLASGVLTGKYDKKTRFTDWRSKGLIGVFKGDGYVKNIGRIDELKKIAESAGKTCAQMAINWVVRQPGLTCALVGVKNEIQMEANLKSIGWELDSNQQEHLNEIFAVE